VICLKNYEDKEVLDLLDQLKTEDVTEKMEVIELDNSQNIISPKVLARIKERTYQRAGIQPLRPKRRGYWYLRMAISMVMLAMVIGGAVVGPHHVWAGIQRTLQFIPGFGMVVEGDDLPRYVLSSPVDINIEGATLTVTGAMADDERTLVQIRATYAPEAPLVKADVAHGEGLVSNIYIEDINGRRFTPSGFSISASYGWQGTFEFPPLENKEDGFRVGFYDEKIAQEVALAVSLAEAVHHENYTTMGPTVTVNGITITAISTFTDNQLNLTLVSPSLEHGRIYSYLQDHIILRGVHGNVAAAKHASSYASPLKQFSFDLTDEMGDLVTLTIPEIVVEHRVTEKVKISLPSEGILELNQTVNLAGYPLVFTAIERLPENKVRVYVDVNYSIDASKTLQSFRLDGAKLPFSSWSVEQNKTTGAYEFIEFEIKPTAHSVTLHFQGAYVLMRGPWALEIPLK